MSTEPKRFMRIIVNGKVAGNSELRSAVGALRDLGYRIDVRVTWEAVDAARMASNAGRDGVDVVIAAGGDGTINEVVNGVVEANAPSSPAIGIVPFGTANDFATACGISSGDVLGALTLAAEGRAVPIDDGRLDLLAIHDVQPTDFRALLDELLNFGFDNRRFVHYLQIQSGVLEFEREFQLNVDGEPLRDTRFAIDVLPGKVSFVLPPQCDLVGKVEGGKI